MRRLVGGLVVVLMVLTANRGVAAAIFADGGNHVVDEWISRSVHVLDSPGGDSTTLDILLGGFVQEHVYLRDSSVLTMSGGTIGGSFLGGDGLPGAPQEAYRAYFAGGTIGNNLYVRVGGFASLSGADVGGWLGASDGSEIDFSGGSVASIMAVQDNSTINWSGGAVGGGNTDDILVENGSVLNILGTDFNYGPSEITSTGPPLSGTLTGKLASGELIDSRFYVANGGSILLHTVPAPSSLTCVAGLFGLAFLARCWRKRKATC